MKKGIVFLAPDQLKPRPSFGSKASKRKRKPTYKELVGIVEELRTVLDAETKMSPEDEKAGDYPSEEVSRILDLAAKAVSDARTGRRAYRKKPVNAGWQQRLREVYINEEEWNSYAEIYQLPTRLGYKTSKEAWEANPVIAGSTNPAEYRKVSE